MMPLAMSTLFAQTPVVYDYPFNMEMSSNYDVPDYMRSWLLILISWNILFTNGDISAVEYTQSMVRKNTRI